MARLDWDKHNRKVKLKKWLMDNSLRSPFWVTSPYEDPDQVGAWARREIQLVLSRTRHQLSINHDFSESPDFRIIESLRQVENTLDAGTTEDLFNSTAAAMSFFTRMNRVGIEQKLLQDLDSVFDLLLTMTQDEDKRAW